MKKSKILRNTFISIAAPLALAPLLFADTNDGLLKLGKTPLLPPAIITIDAPAAGTGPFQGTVCIGINPAGLIAGYYFDANTVTHSFVRGSDGTIMSFDAPGGGTGPYQ